MKAKIILMISMLVISQSIWAHAYLDASTPENGAKIKSSPEHISLTFSKPVKLFKFEYLSPQNESLETGFKASMVDQSEYVIEVNSSVDGLHSVYWTIMGQDGHKVEGYFQFTVDHMRDSEV